VLEHKYLYCTLCKKLFVISADKLKEIDDMNLIVEAKKVTGNQI
jgi:hypothetical protein